MKKVCTECEGRLKETGDVLVLADGYERAICKCESCGKES